MTPPSATTSPEAAKRPSLHGAIQCRLVSPHSYKPSLPKLARCVPGMTSHLDNRPHRQPGQNPTRPRLQTPTLGVSQRGRNLSQRQFAQRAFEAITMRVCWCFRLFCCFRQWRTHMAPTWLNRKSIKPCGSHVLRGRPGCTPSWAACRNACPIQPNAWSHVR